MQAPESVPSFGLIIVGDEILSGKRQDKHLTKVIELLSERGLHLGHADYVGDDPVRLTQTRRRSFETPGVVFCCGGIGATPDDHTRQCAALALGQDLVLHTEAKLLIEERAREIALEQGVAFDTYQATHQHRLHRPLLPRIHPGVVVRRSRTR